MQTQGRTIILLATGLLLAVVLTTAVLLLNNHLASSQPAPQPPIVVAYTPVAEWQPLVSLADLTPSPQACGGNPFSTTITSINTLDDMIIRLGPPEKVYTWRQGGPENLFMNYGSKYLYPTKGVNFISPEGHTLNNPTTGMPSNGPASLPHSNGLITDSQTPIAFECYPPTDLPSYLATHLVSQSYSSNFGEEYVDWTTP